MSDTTTIGSLAGRPQSFCAARAMTADTRRRLAVEALAGVEPIAALARGHDVSRKFVYAQAAEAREALDERFAASGAENHVLFTVAVTTQWLETFILDLVLNGHSPLRGVQAIIEDLFPASVSLGTIHNVVGAAAARARNLNATEELSGVRVGAHDEIFQAGQPVLVGVDARSTYTYLLNVAAGRGETDWGVPLLELADKGLRPAYTVADFGRGLRAGQAAAWPGIACHGDVFHAECALGQAAVYLEHRAWGAMATVEKLTRRMERAKQHQEGHRFSAALATARAEETAAVQLADDVATLARWLREDVLCVAGPDLATRRELFDWLVAQLRLRDAQAPHRLTPVCRLLENNRDAILGFAAAFEEHVARLAREFHVAEATVYQVSLLPALPAEDSRRWQQEAALWQQLGERFPRLQAAVQHCLAQLVRASSVVENLNSRLRSYFFLRRELGPAYLELLRFFFNHRPFPRSRRQERVHRSPAELLTGRTHPHWLAMLGYQPCAHAA